MIEILKTLKDTPLPIVLVIGGLIFLLIPFIQKITTKEVGFEMTNQVLAGFIGLLLLIIGIGLYFIPSGTAVSGSTVAIASPTSDIGTAIPKTPTQMLECSTNFTWDMQNPILGGYPTRTGSLNTNNEWFVDPSKDSRGWFQVGPYTAQVSAGDHVAKWYLMIDNNSLDDSDIVRLEVSDFVNEQDQTVLASKILSRHDWDSPMTYQCFSLPFTIDASKVGHTLEFRIWWYGKGVVHQLRVSVE